MLTDPDQPVEFSRDLLTAVRDLSFARELSEVTSIVRTTARRLTRADGVTFVLKDGDQCYYADEDAIAPLWKGRRFPLAACISGWVMTNGRSVVIPDIYADPRIPHDAYRPTFVKSLAMVPVRAEAPVAAVGAYWASTHEATAAEIRALEAIADAASLALTNVQLWADLQSVNRKLQQRLTEFETLLDVLPVGIGIAYDSRANDIRTNKRFSDDPPARWSRHRAFDRQEPHGSSRRHRACQERRRWQGRDVHADAAAERVGGADQRSPGGRHHIGTRD